MFRAGSFIKPSGAFRAIGSLSSTLLSRVWSPDVVRIVCISDTHNQEFSWKSIPAGDVLIHAGDFSSTGTLPELTKFRAFMRSLPHFEKIVIAGNHDITLQPEYYAAHGYRFHSKFFGTPGFDPYKYAQECREVICTDAPPSYTYLQDSSCRIMAPMEDELLPRQGIETYGSPWQPEFYNWAFNKIRGADIKEKWDLIPDTTDVLITHGPPKDILDLCAHGGRVGCEMLRDAIVKRVKPRLHIFGHIHESYGTYFDGTTTFVNASTCTLQYKPTNPAIVVDLPHDPTLPAEIVSAHWL